MCIFPNVGIRAKIYAAALIRNSSELNPVQIKKEL